MDTASSVRQFVLQAIQDRSNPNTVATTFHMALTFTTDVQGEIFFFQEQNLGKWQQKCNSHKRQHHRWDYHCAKNDNLETL